MMMIAATFRCVQSTLPVWNLFSYAAIILVAALQGMQHVNHLTNRKNPRLREAE